MTKYETEKRDVLGPLLVAPAITVYGSAIRSLVGRRDRSKPPVLNQIDLLHLTADACKEVTHKLHRQASPQYWVSLLAIHRAITGQANHFTTFARTPTKVLEEGLKTGLIMPFNLLRRLMEQPDVQQRIDVEFERNVGLWATTVLLRQDTSDVLRRLAAGKNGALGSASTSPSLIDNLVLEQQGPHIPIAKWEDDQVVMPVEIYERIHNDACHDPASRVGCPARFRFSNNHDVRSPEAHREPTVIDRGRLTFATLLLDRVLANQ